MFLPLSMFTPTQAAILFGIAALLGACMGSFINCLAWRTVNGESVLAGRSHCATCGHVLGVLDLIPIVSWFALRGQCRYCKQRVSARYVIVEIIMAATFAALLAVYGPGIPWVAYVALAVVLMGVALVDFDTFTIPNGFILAALIIWVFFMVASAALPAELLPASLTSAGAGSLPVGVGASAAVFSLSTTPALVDESVFGIAPAGLSPTAPFTLGTLFVPLVGAGWQAGVLDGLAGAFLVGGGILVFSLVFDAITKRTSLGGGDVKLLFVVGLFLGLAGSLLNLLIACILGLVFAVLFPRLSAGVPSSVEASAETFRTRPFPFGPAIAAATVVTLLAAPSFLAWYVGLF